MHRTSSGGHSQTGSASHSDWTIRERLVLSSSVLSSGDQNWVSVSRTVKPLLEGDKPPDKFSQKNCAMEYSDMLEKVAPLKRKRSTDLGTGETPGEQIVRRLTCERIEELKKSIKLQHALYKKLKQEAKLIADGKLDHKLEQMWQEIQAEKRAQARLLGLPVEDSPTPPVTVLGNKSTTASTAESKQQEPQRMKPNDMQTDMQVTESVEHLESGRMDSQQKQSDSSVQRDVTTQPVKGTLCPDEDKECNVSKPDHVTCRATDVTDSSADHVTQKTEQSGSETETETKTESNSNQRGASVSKPSALTERRGTQHDGDTHDKRKDGTMETDEGANVVKEDGSTVGDEDMMGECETDATMSPEEMSVDNVPTDLVDDNEKEVTEKVNERERKQELDGDSKGEAGEQELKEDASSDVRKLEHTEREAVEELHEEDETTNKVEMKSEEAENGSDKKERVDEETIEDTQPQQEETALQVEVKTEEELVHSVEDNQASVVSKTSSTSTHLTLSLPVSTTMQEGITEQSGVVAKPDSPVSRQCVTQLKTDPVTAKPPQGVISTITRPLILRPFHKTAVPTATTPTATVPSQPSQPPMPLSHHSTGLPIMPPILTLGQSLSVGAPCVSYSPAVVQAHNVVSALGSPESNRPLQATGGGHTDTSSLGTVEKSLRGSRTNLVTSLSEVNEETRESSVATVEFIKEKETSAPSKVEDVVQTPTHPRETLVEVRRTRRSSEMSERKLSEPGESISNEMEDTRSSKLTRKAKGHKRIRRSSMRTRSRDRESDSPMDEDSRESFPDLEAESSKLQDFDEKCATARTPMEMITESATSAETEQLGEDSTALVREVEELLEAPPTTEAVDVAEEEESAVEDDDIPSFIPSAFSSAPSSPPASVGDMDIEAAQARRTWKKSIMVVWRKIAEHRYANLFLKAVSQREAPGYRDVVYRPTDLATIKANVESGVLRTTEEFQHSVLLMFQNALMYNASDHQVYQMAEEMRSDFLEHVEEFVALQVVVNSQPERKGLRGVSPALRSKRSEKEELPLVRQSLEEVELKRIRRSSADSTEMPPSKRRKVRGDDTLMT